MRIALGDLGLGQQNAGLITTAGQTGYNGITCDLAGGTWDGTNALCDLPMLASAPVAPVPVGYDASTGTVSSSNTIGQTESNLAANPSDLCTQQGGTWDGSTCNQSSLCSLPLGTYDESTGTCDYTELYLVAGGAAILLVALLIMSSSGGKRRR